MQTKVCSKCGANKCITQYSADKSVRSGVRSKCKVCCADQEKARQAGDPDAWNKRRSATRIAWVEKNKERVTKYKKEHHAMHYAERYAPKNRMRQRSQIAALSDEYILRSMRINKSDAPHWLIELKREKMKIYRAMKQLNQAITNQQENDK